MRRRGERGEGRIGTIIWLLVLVAVGLASWAYIPARIARAEIKDFMTEQTKFAARNSPRSLQKSIFREAQRLNLPVEEKNIEVSKANGRVRMKIKYTVELDMRFYKMPYHVEEVVDRDVFMF